MRIKTEQRLKDERLLMTFLEEIERTLKRNHLSHTAGMMAQAKEIAKRLEGA